MTAQAAMDYAKFFTKITGRRRSNIIRQFTNAYLSTPNAISMASGMPNASVFPFGEISITLKDGEQHKLIDQDLTTALQYGPSQGYMPLVKKWKEFQQQWHLPKRDDWDVVFTPGSQDACGKFFEMIIDEGEAVMIQTPTYTGTIGAHADKVAFVKRHRSRRGTEMDFTKFYSDMGKRREIMYVNVLARDDQHLLQLGEGKTSPKIFPIEEISVRFKGNKNCNFDNYEMRQALGLGRAQGCAPLLKKMEEMMKRYHSPQRNDWDIVITTGSQDALTRVCEIIIDPGDPVMIQIPIYFGVDGVIRPLQPDFIGIEQDADGIIPEKIAAVCEERLRTGKPMPKLLYVNPTGANPTGSVLTEARKRQVYELAQKYDFLILEDDAYYFVHFLDKLPTSFFSLDTDGRVIRLDSFSKIMSAGIRVGVVTAHKDLIDKLIIHVENTILHTSALSQMILYKLFDTWSPRRFEQHFKEIQDFYRRNRDIMLTAMEKHLTGLAEWSVPKAGMFIWIKVKGIDNVLDLVTKKCVPHGVFVLPGNAFNYDVTLPDQHLRLSYSYATPEEIDKGLAIVAKLIREETKQTNGV